MEEPIVDFDPNEGILFPQPVEQKLSSMDFMKRIRAHAVEPRKVAMWHLGQNSWILKDHDGTIVAIDPYLTDYCASKRTLEKKPKSRLLPVFIEPEDLDVDIVLITHSHCDHCDPFTLERLRIKESADFLAPWQAMTIIGEAGIPAKRRVLMHPLQTVKVRNIDVTGTFAEPTDFTDLNHMGFVLKFPDDRVYYNSGDTAKTELLEHVRHFQPEWMSICINGGYHNLSHWEAAEICALLQPKIAIPAHYDMMPHNLQSPHMFRKSLFEKAPGIRYLRFEYYRAYEF